MMMIADHEDVEIPYWKMMMMRTVSMILAYEGEDEGEIPFCRRIT